MTRQSCLFSAVLIVASAICSAPCAQSQEYRFGVPKAKMLVVVRPKAAVHITYDFTFQNAPNGHVIDVVDIGVPHAGYDLGNVRAWLNDSPLGDIRVSQYVKPGFEVHLGAKAILPGRSGRFRVTFEIPDMVFQDTTRADYASLRITPTWFGEQYVLGRTHLQVAIQLPKTVRPDEVLHQGVEFSKKAKSDQGALVGWDFPTTRLTGPHPVAVSFPKRDMQRVIHTTAFDLLVKWFQESPRARFVLGSVFLILLGILFFRFSGGTGFSVYFLLAGGACVWFIFSPVAHLLAMPIMVALIGVNEWFLARRKMRYMPPIAQLEGGGIKRGLTAPEAAVLLELPLPKVLSLVIFGLLKKGVLHQIQADPLTVQVEGAFCVAPQPAADGMKESEKRFHEAAIQRGVVIHGYERPFLCLLQNNPGKAVREIDFSLPVRLLIKSAAGRMAGFDLKETKEYYRSIIRRAVEQASAIGDIPQRERMIDRHFEWILMDDHYGPVFEGPPYWPVWTRGSTVWTAGGGSPVPPPPPNLPGGTSFGDVASSFSGWLENTMGNMASSLAPESLGAGNAGGGFLNLSGADQATGQFFQALAESAAKGGGGGGGCACAGCACACACAGGGR